MAASQEAAHPVLPLPPVSAPGAVAGRIIRSLARATEMKLTDRKYPKLEAFLPRRACELVEHDFGEGCELNQTV